MQRVDSTLFPSAARLPVIESLLTERQIARLRQLAFEPKAPPPSLDAASLLEWRLRFGKVGAGIFLPVLVRDIMSGWEEDGAAGKGPLRRAGLRRIGGAAAAAATTDNKSSKKSAESRPNKNLIRASGAPASSSSDDDDERKKENDDGSEYYARYEKVFSHKDLLVGLIRWAIAVGVRSRLSSAAGAATSTTAGGPHGENSGTGAAAAVPASSAHDDKIWDDVTNGASAAAASLLLPPSEVRLTTEALLAPSQKALEELRAARAESNAGGGVSSGFFDGDEDGGEDDEEPEPYTFSESIVFGAPDRDASNRSDGAGPQHQQQAKRKRVGAFWEVELRDYFLRWSDLTTALLAGSAAVVFGNAGDGAAATSHANDGAALGDAGASPAVVAAAAAASSYMPYASTRVVHSLKKRAMAAAKHALGNDGDAALGDSSSSDGDDDGIVDSALFDADSLDGGRKHRGNKKKHRKGGRKRDPYGEVEQLHHAPVTSAVVSSRIGAIVTGSLDGTVKLWDRQSGAFRRNIYCCSGRTTVCGLACVPAGPSGDVVVIGTSTSHLALFSTLTGTVVKEYLGTSERRPGSSGMRWSGVVHGPVSAFAKKQQQQQEKEEHQHEHESDNEDGRTRKHPHPPGTHRYAQGTKSFQLRPAAASSNNNSNPETDREEDDDADEQRDSKKQQRTEDAEKAEAELSGSARRMNALVKKMQRNERQQALDEQLELEQNQRDARLSTPLGRHRANRVPPVALRPTFTASRYRALPGTYGKRLIKPPPIETASDARAFFDEWREAQEREVPRTVPAAQIHNLQRLSILQSIQPNLGEPSIVAFGTADGTVGLLDLNEEFVDAVTYGVDTGRSLQSVAVVPTHSSTVTSIAYCHRHRAVLSCAYDGAIIPRNIETSALMPALGHPTKAIASMSWCEQQQMLATVTSDRRAYAWSFLGRRPIHEVLLDARPVSVVLHSGKCQMAVLCEDRQLLIYDTRTFRCLQGLSVVTDRAEREATIVVGGDGDELQDLDLAAKSTLATLDRASTYISPYDTQELHRGAGLLIADESDIIAVHREVSVLKDSLGKVSVRVRHDGKTPIYGFRFDVFDETLENAPNQQQAPSQAQTQERRTSESGSSPARRASGGGGAATGSSPRRTSIVGFGNPSGSTAPDAAVVSLAGHANLTGTAERRRSSVTNLNPTELAVSVSASFVGFERDDPHATSLIRRDGGVGATLAARKRSLGQSSASPSPTARDRGSPTAKLQQRRFNDNSAASPVVAPSPQEQLRQARSVIERRRGSAALFVNGGSSSNSPPLSPSQQQQQQQRSPRRQSLAAIAATRPVLKAPPVGVLYNKKNGLVVVADADGFLGIDVRSGEVIFCVASEKSLAQTTSDLAGGGRLVAQTRSIAWTPCDAARMRGIQHDSFLSLSKMGGIAEWNVVDGTAMRVTPPEAWAAELGQGMRRPRRDRAFGDMCACEKLVAIAQNETVFVLNEQARRAPKMTAQCVDVDVFSEIVESEHHRHQQQQQQTAAASSPTRDRAASPTKLLMSLSSPASAASDSSAEQAAGGKKVVASKVDSNNRSSSSSSPNKKQQPVAHQPFAVKTAPFAGHNAFSVDCGDTITAMHFSAGCEYLAVGTLKGLLHTVHVDTAETIAMTLSLLRAGEPTSPIAAVTWNNHVGDLTVFAAVALGRVVAIHAPTRTVMLSLAVDLGPAHLGILLSSLHVQRHQSRGGTALEALAIGDTGGVVRVATLQVRKQSELERERELRQQLEASQQQQQQQSGTDTRSGVGERVPSFREKAFESSDNNINRPRSRGGSGSAPPPRRKTSFTYSQIQHTNSGIEWSVPVTVSVLPERDHKLSHLRSLRDLLDFNASPEDFERERRNSAQKMQFFGDASGSSDDDDDDDDDSSSGDQDGGSGGNMSDDDVAQQVLLKTFSGAHIRRQSHLQQHKKAAVGTTSLLNLSSSAHTAISDAHLTQRSRIHEERKQRRRLQVLNDPSSKVGAATASAFSPPSSSASSVLVADRAVSMMKGAFAKRRRGFIFEDAYDFLEPETGGHHSPSAAAAAATATSAPSASKRPDKDRPVWCGAVDGSICVRDPANGGCSGPVCQVQFLALRRLGVRHGMALLAAATTDGNVSILRWARVHDDEPSSLVCLTRLRCPITSMSRGPFWNDGLLALQPPPKREDAVVAAAAGAGASLAGTAQPQQQQQQRGSFFLTESAKNERPSSGSGSGAGATLGSFVGMPAATATTTGDSARRPDSAGNAFTPQRRGTSGSGATFLSPRPPPAAASSPSVPYQNYRPLTDDEQAQIARHDQMLGDFLPRDKLWSPLGTGYTHDESNMVLCLDDKWEQCEADAELKPREIAPPSKAQVKRQKSIVRRRASAVNFSGVSPTTKKLDTPTGSAAGTGFAAFDDDIFGAKSEEKEQPAQQQQQQPTPPQSKDDDVASALIASGAMTLPLALIPEVSVTPTATGGVGGGGSNATPATRPPSSLSGASQQHHLVAASADRLRPVSSSSRVPHLFVRTASQLFEPSPLQRAPSTAALSASAGTLSARTVSSLHSNTGRHRERTPSLILQEQQAQEAQDELYRRQLAEAERAAREQWRGVQIEQRPDSERLKAAFQRCRAVGRGDIRLQTTHPLLDSCHAKLEQASDVHRESMQKLEKELMPAWLSSLRDGQTPMALSSVMMMSRPPPILLKKHKRV